MDELLKDACRASGSNVYAHIRPALLCPVVIWEAEFLEVEEGLLRGVGQGCADADLDPVL